MKIAIVGAGMMGHVLAFRLSRAGHEIHLFDKSRFVPDADVSGSAFAQSEVYAQSSAAHAAAGMIAPYSEMDSADSLVFKLGIEALPLWKDIAESLEKLTGLGVDYRACGSLIVAHPQDEADLDQFKRALKNNIPVSSRQAIASLERPALRELGASLSKRFGRALYIREEACVSPVCVMTAIRRFLVQKNASFYEGVSFAHLNENSLVPYGKYDAVFDCRGLGAKGDMQALRGVRGESVLLHAPEVELNKVVRLMHPRYKLYIVPRANHQYLIGATQIESNDESPISVRSALELLSAVYSVDEGFAEARVLRSYAACRPAMPDNSPVLSLDKRVFRINGLYRHGVMISPAIAERALVLLEKGSGSLCEHKNLLFQSSSLTEDDCSLESVAAT